MTESVLAVARDGAHRFSKLTADSITLVAGLGVEGDAHAGQTVQHLSRKAKTPDAPNLRQVHLIHAELFEELAQKGFAVVPALLGENVTTTGIDLLGLSVGTRLRLGATAEIEITGLRNPCGQIDGIAHGLMKALLDRTDEGVLVRKCGVMAVVLTGGEVRAGDPIVLTNVPQPWIALPVV
jgi:MOSC domain-containing protein YiiM